MNMLKNWLPLAAMTQEDRDCFLDLKGFEWECLQESSSMAQAEWSTIGSPIDVNRTKGNIIPRLKLKEGEFYTCKDMMGNYCTKQWDGKEEFNFSMVFFRPTTQSEINSVKPEFKCGDVVDGGNGYIARMQSESSRKSYNLLSRIKKDGGFCFNMPHGVDIADCKQATPDQIKQLELEEMKHGKKWNGDGYDEYLICGMTINEYLEGDYELEYASRGDNYELIEHSKHKVAENLLNKLGQINLYRLKPKDEGFVDVKIDWFSGMRSFVRIENSNIRLCASDVMNPIKGMMFTGFVFDKDDELMESVLDESVRLSDDRKSIEYKATHARFVKL